MSEDRTLLLRAAAVAAALIWMQAGPVVTQLLGLPRPPGTSTWTMYHGRGADLCAVEWFTRAPDGALTPVDRHAVMGWSWPKPVQRIEGEPALRRAAAALCRELGRGVDLRARARCGHPGGWAPALDLDVPLCRR